MPSYVYDLFYFHYWYMEILFRQNDDRFYILSIYKGLGWELIGYLYPMRRLIEDMEKPRGHEMCLKCLISVHHSKFAQLVWVTHIFRSF